MKFDDTDTDYFLHDFSKGNQSTASDSPEPMRSGEAPEFTFGDEAPAPPRRKRRGGLVWFFIIVIAALGAAVYVRYFVPYVSESRTVGYVTLVEKRGIIFPTFEGEMVSESLLTDTTRIYSRDLYFSIPNDSLALALQKYQATGRPVVITCNRYYGTLPWRGATNVVLTSFREE